MKVGHRQNTNLTVRGRPRVRSALVTCSGWYCTSHCRGVCTTVFSLGLSLHLRLVSRRMQIEGGELLGETRGLDQAWLYTWCYLMLRRTLDPASDYLLTSQRLWRPEDIDRISATMVWTVGFASLVETVGAVAEEELSIWSLPLDVWGCLQHSWRGPF